MSRATKMLAWAVGVALVIPAILFAFRWTGVVFVIVSVLLMALQSGLRTQRMCAVMLAGFLICSLSPMDISFETRPGRPKVLPVYYGKPGADLLAREAKGEILLGGCVLRGYDPLWILVW